MPRPLPDVAASHPGPRRSALAELEAWQRLVICGRPEQVAVARAFVRQVLGTGHPALDRVTLLTSELVTNSVNHSDSRLGGGSITVTVRPVTVGSGAGCVRVEVTDDGAATAPVMHRDDDLAETGRGLRLVEAYSLMWDYYRDGTRTVTWFECEPEPLALRAVRHKKGSNAFPRSGPAPTRCGRRRHGPCGGRCARRSSRAAPG
jgi:anti-sigma regulatory factor (Ser/Thr protein kinase)